MRSNEAHRGRYRGPLNPIEAHRPFEPLSKSLLTPIEAPVEAHRAHRGPVETPIETHRGSFEALSKSSESLLKPIEAQRGAYRRPSDPIEAHRPFEALSRILSRPIEAPAEAHRGPIETPIEALSRSVEALLGRIGTQRGPYRRPPRLYRGPSPHQGLIEAPIEALVEALVEALSRPYRDPHRGLSEALSRSIEVY
jgi:hypothetical protein